MPVNVVQAGSILGDDWFTQDKDAEIIAQHIIHPMRIWLPFNDRGKAFDRVLSAHGHQCVCTDGDFFETPPPGWGAGGCLKSAVFQKGRRRKAA